MNTATIQRLEFAALTAVIVAAYAYLQGPWWLFAALWLTPDLAMVGYLRGPKFGAITYNLAHTLVLPIALAAIGLAAHGSGLELLALIWLSHITADRALGYGLKLPTGFKDTHLGRAGLTQTV